MSALVSVKTGVELTKVAPVTEVAVEIKYVPPCAEVVSPKAITSIAGLTKVSMKSVSVMACICEPFQYTGNVLPVSDVVILGEPTV